MFTNLNTDSSKRPRLLGELGDLSYKQISAVEFKYRKDSEIFGEGEAAEYLYQVIKGAVRSHKLLSDGRRQIGAFHLAGDVFGLENGEHHRFTAEAVVDTTVRLMKRQSLERVAKSDKALIFKILGMTTDNLQHVENHLLLLGRKQSLERVAALRGFMGTNDYHESRRIGALREYLKSLLLEFAVGEEARGTLTRSVFKVPCSLSCNGANVS